MIGESIGNYRIDDKLGSGGMGVVYKATDKDLGRTVAIKMLTAVPSEYQREAVARFLREAKAESRLQHPAIVTIHHFATEGDTQYIVMEYVEGKSLKEIIDGKAMPLNQLCEIAIQVADGLALAHEKGVIHRDIKSQNVMITSRGHAKILDFGLAKLKEAAEAGSQAADIHKTAIYGEETIGPADMPHGEFLTQVGTIMGTASHMSPEQAHGVEIDVQTDIFSFGVMLYEMATGKLAFEADSVAATLLNILQKEPTPVTQLNPQVPPELARLIHQCLVKNKAFRPHANDLVEDLKKIQASLSAGRLASPEMKPVISSSGETIRASAPEPEVTVAAVPRSGPRAAAPPPPQAPEVVVRPPAPRVRAKKARPVSGARRELYWQLKILRLIVSYATMILPLSYFLHFLIDGGIIHHRFIEGTVVMSAIRVLVLPVLSLTKRIIGLNLTFGGWDFMIVALGVGALFVRFAIVLPLEKLERWAKGPAR